MSTNQYMTADDANVTTDTPTWEMTSAQRLRRLLRENMYQRDSNKPELYVLNRHVSRSGMLRRVSVFLVVAGELVDVTNHVAHVTGWKLHTDRNTWADTLTVRGAGMDMHFHTVYTLGRALYGDANDAGYMIKHVTI